jgi:hypothetical protein
VFFLDHLYNVNKVSCKTTSFSNNETGQNQYFYLRYKTSSDWLKTTLNRQFEVFFDSVSSVENVNCENVDNVKLWGCRECKIVRMWFFELKSAPQKSRIIYTYSIWFVW